MRRSLAALLLLSCVVVSCVAQTAAQTEVDPTLLLERLFAQQRWSEVVRLAEPVTPRSADIDFYYASALAQLGRWDEARNAFEAGRHRQPRDKRFPIELAGVEFKQNHYAQAAGWLHIALRIDPTDAYANDFLGTIYFLQDNIEAALKYWNRSGKPEIYRVSTEPEPRLKPALLDRAFAFSPASILHEQDLPITEARLNGLQMFSSHVLALKAREDGQFDVVLRAHERNGWGDTKWQGLASSLRGVFYQTIYPEFFNLNHSAINLESQIRWDAQKRRALVSLSGPYRQNPKWRYQLSADFRNENWDVRDSALGSTPFLAALNLRKQAATVGITCFPGGRWSWSNEVEFSHRDYRDVSNGSALGADLLLQGYQAKNISRISYGLLRVPEHRFEINTSASSQAGRIWSNPAYSFAKLQGSVEAHWFPQSSGEDYEMREQVRVGTTFGSTPFDELFMLSLERDNDLWLRGHVGTHDGRKGYAPLGRDYFLSNWETDKKVYSNGLVTLKLGPFLDVGRITGPSPDLGSQKWLYDTGVQTKVRLLGVNIAFIYGKDLRSGNNLFYVTAGR